MKGSDVTLIKGAISKDQRGQIRFVNDFHMADIKRFYMIKNRNDSIVRGWRGHRRERRWFYVISGAFVIDIVKIDDWEVPSRELCIDRYILKDSDQSLLSVDRGHATAFRALNEDSELLVFADHELADAKLDDYTWPEDYFIERQV